MFITAINDIERSVARQNALILTFGINNGHYDEIFFSVIDKLIELKFGPGLSEIIFFYIYDRTNIDGTINALSDPKGKEIKLSNPEDLWNLITQINPNIEKQK